MASKSAQQEPEKAEVIEEALDTVDSTLDRVKVLYEQYFLGIQKQPPQYLHSDVERKLRDLAQLQIRNTALRYRFVTLQQKFGSYNTYWRRTLREIEAGRYHRSLSKVTRHAAATGAEIPSEILAAMPRRMREQVRRDREAQLALQRRRGEDGGGREVSAGDDAELLTLAPLEDEDGAGFVHEPTDVRRAALRAHGGAYVLDDSVSDADIDAYFRQVEAEAAAEAAATAARGVAAARPPAGASGAATAPPAPAEARPPAGASGAATATAPPAPADVRFPDFIAVRSPRSVPSPEGPPAQPVSRSRAAWPSVAIDTSPGIGPSPAGATLRPPASRAATEPPAGSPERPVSGQIEIERPMSGQLAAPSPPLGAAPSKLPPIAPSQQARPNPIAPGSASVRATASVEVMAGPFPREAPAGAGSAPPAPPSPVAAQPRAASPALRPPPPGASPPSRPTPPGASPPSRPTPPSASPPSRPPPPGASPAATGRPPPEPRAAPPPGMTQADVDALYARYVQAKQMVGEATGPSSFRKLMKTINAQAPKIMEQYRARGVDFSVVIKDNQVIIRAKPKM